MFDNFVKYAIDRGGSIKPLLIDPQLTNGLGLMNPSVYVDDDERIVVNIRSVNYTLYNCEISDYDHIWGPLVYIHPEDDLRLKTKNYISILNENLDTVRTHWVDTSGFDKKPIWEFVGLEDARLVKWDNKYYMTGVRRDVNTVGCCRMDLSEVEISDDCVKEVKRMRVPTPSRRQSYCEKNWMPVLDMPYHYVKWGNPVEVVKYDIETNTTETVTCSDFDPSVDRDLRGGSQAIPYKDGHVGIHHITRMRKNIADRRDGRYTHEFAYWDKDWNTVKRSDEFSFLSAKVEFCCGMVEYRDSYLITFGFMDNAAYILRVPKFALEEFINESRSN
ncbi:MAG: hypothetical protein CBD74_07825 [Saprospirales bacterium TMED214]|nr:MAG: hypothetical protein CBD74_07825 [Saprospirales bacterium TMED214]